MPRGPRIAGRVALAFAVIIGIFVVALVATDSILTEVKDAERQVERLDSAKHAAHHVAAMAREMYIHQAQTIITFGPSHLEHYEVWANETRRGTERLRDVAPTAADRAQVERITALTERIDEEFRRLILPAIQRGEREHIVELHERIDAIRMEVIHQNRSLAADFEGRARAARTAAEARMGHARLGILACTAMAALAAMLAASLLLRSILRPVSALRQGALEVAGGNLAHRIGWTSDDELGELTQTFNQMIADLERHQADALEAQRLRILGEITAGVAHELNNPLGVILGYLRLIEKDDNPSKERLATIADETRQCQRIVADLLEVVRPEDLEPASIDVGELVRGAADRIRDATSHPALSVTTEEGVQVWGDPARLRQVLDNLIGNAVEACPEGTIHVEVRGDAEVAHARVADSGPGVPAETRERVFDPFFTTKAAGTGLGLAISRAIVEAHGGKLRLAEARVGAAFEMDLPRLRPNKEAKA